MKLVIMDGYALNPGDLSYDCLNQFGEVTVYHRTDSEEEAIAPKLYSSTRCPSPSPFWRPAPASA